MPRGPFGLSARSATEYAEGHTLVEMIKEDLIAERVVIDTYADMIRYLGNSDPTTRAMLEDILASEEDHAQELSTLLATLDPTKPGG